MTNPYFRQAVIRLDRGAKPFGRHDCRRVDRRGIGPYGGGLASAVCEAGLCDQPLRLRSPLRGRYRAWQLARELHHRKFADPLLGAVNASLKNKMILGKIMGGGYRDPRKLPADLLWPSSMKSPTARDTSGSRARCWQAGDPGARHAITIVRSRRQ